MKLYNFQRESVKWLLGRKRAILGSEMGTGKTAVAIRAARYLREKGHAKLIYVVCPASLKLNWVTEITQWEERLSCYIKRVDKLKDSHPVKILLTDSAYYEIFSYEIFSKICNDLPTPDVLICDESHKLKNKTAKRTKNILTFAEKVKHVYLLTGTPMPNSIIDAWTTFNFCSYGALGSYWHFANTYCYIDKNRFGMKAYGAKNMDKLKSLASAFLRRDTVAEHLQELPEEQIIKIDLEHTKESKKYISSDKETSVINKFIDGESLDADEKEIAEHLMSRRRELGVIKVKQAVEFITNLLEQGEQVVVFAHHRDVVNGIYNGLADYKVGKIFGDTPAAVRHDLVINFQNEVFPWAEKLQCLILGIQAGGVGLTLTAAKVSVFVEAPWVPADFDQAKARIRRIGQKNFCTHYVLNYPLTLDETVLSAMQRKGKDINKFFEARV